MVLSLIPLNKVDHMKIFLMAIHVIRVRTAKLYHTWHDAKPQLPFWNDFEPRSAELKCIIPH